MHISDTLNIRKQMKFFFFSFPLLIFNYNKLREKDNIAISRSAHQFNKESVEPSVFHRTPLRTCKANVWYPQSHCLLFINSMTNVSHAPQWQHLHFLPSCWVLSFFFLIFFFFVFRIYKDRFNVSPSRSPHPHPFMFSERISSAEQRYLKEFPPRAVNLLLICLEWEFFFFSCRNEKRKSKLCNVSDFLG